VPAADVHIERHQELPPALLRSGSRARSSEEARAPSGHCYSSLVFDRNRSGCNVSVVTYRCQTGSLILFALSAIRHASTIDDSLAARHKCKPCELPRSSPKYQVLAWSMLHH
jgi:hypothetical protein